MGPAPMRLKVQYLGIGVSFIDSVKRVKTSYSFTPQPFTEVGIYRIDHRALDGVGE